MYGINPPRFAGSTLFYKDIVIFEMKDKNAKKIDKAWKYDIMGNRKEIPAYEVEIPKVLTEYKGIIHPSNNVIDSTIRTGWLFPTVEEAFITKLLLLSHLRNYFLKKQEEQKIYFDSKIPPEIEQVIETQKRLNPELFL